MQAASAKLRIRASFGLLNSWPLLDEEAFLSNNITGYDEYRNKVRYRLIPRVR